MRNGTAGTMDGAELPRTFIDLPCIVRLKSRVVGPFVGPGTVRVERMNLLNSLWNVLLKLGMVRLLKLL